MLFCAVHTLRQSLAISLPVAADLAPMALGYELIPGSLRFHGDVQPIHHFDMLNASEVYLSSIAFGGMMLIRSSAPSGVPGFPLLCGTQPSHEARFSAACFPAALRSGRRFTMSLALLLAAGSHQA